MTSSGHPYAELFVRAGLSKRHHSVVVYQHFPRRPRDAFLGEVATRIRIETGCRDVLAVATAHVAFVILPQVSVMESLASRLEAFASRAIPHARMLRITQK